MRIGIDISQIVYEGTGVARYVKELIPIIVRNAPEHEFVLFGCSLRQTHKLRKFCQSISLISPKVTSRIYSLPLSLLDTLWNVLHICPIEWWIGPLDIFWSSDWVQPPINKKTIGVTTVHDVSFLHFPEMFHSLILSVQKRRMKRVLQECSLVLCDSHATEEDLQNFYHMRKEKCVVVYPGYHA